MANTDARTREYKELVELQTYYEKQVEAYRRDIYQMVEHKRARREREITRAYDQSIKKLEEAEALRRLDAIARFERFIEKYPDDPRYTPDAMYRLAELYFRNSSDEYLAAYEDYDEQYRKFEQGILAAEPEEPTKEYSQSIGLYQQLIAEFPEYRFADGALYLLGYCLKQQGEDREAKEAWSRLTEAYPESEFVAEALTRIGEYYFDANELDSAIATYLKAKTHTDSPWYDKILYKLGWTYYRIDRFDEAVSTFAQLLDIYDKMTEEELANRGDLKKEAIEYTAVSFSEPEWGRGTAGGTSLSAEDEDLLSLGDEGMDLGKNIEKTKQFFKEKYPDRKWERAIWKKFADVLFKNTRYREAIEAYRYALILNPLAIDAPELQEQIVRAYAERRELDRWAAEMERMVENYSEGSKWWEANKDDLDAQRKAKDKGKAMLYAAAAFHHQTAQKLAGSAEEADQQKTMAEYRLAADLYREYLRRYPHDENAYELTYLLGDTLYFSQQFAEAADVFAKVRDSSFGDKYRVESAKSVLFCLREVLKAAERDKTLPPVPKYATPQDLPKAPLEIPELRMKVVDAGDRFLHYVPDNKDAPVIGYNAALVYYNYGHFDEAEKRLTFLMDKYPQAEFARDSVKLMIDRYIALNDYEKVAVWATKLQEIAAQQTGEDAKKDAAEGAALFVGARFNVATKWMKEGKYEEAANEFLRIVDENKEYEKADIGVNNAAVCFSKSKRYITAMETYERLVRDYPDSALSANATWLIALNAEQGFDFKKAIQFYDKLVAKYKTHEKRAFAAFNAALLREKLGNYKAAAQGYERYVKLFPDRDDAPSTFFFAGRVFEKAGDIRNMTRVFKTFISKFGRDPENFKYVMEAYVKIGDYYYDQLQRARTPRGKRDLKKKVMSFYQDAVDFYARHNLQPAGVEAEYAAKAAFRLAEFRLPEFDRAKITGGKRKRKFEENLKNSFQSTMDKIKELQEVYKDVQKYARPDWFLASMFRLGYFPQKLAKKIMEAPAPPDIRRDELALEVYNEMLMKMALPIEDAAVKAYQEVVSTSERFNFTNEFVTKAKLGLSALRPSEFKMDKPPRDMESWDDALIRPLVGAPEVQLPEEAPPAPPPEGSGEVGAKGDAAGDGAAVPESPDGDKVEADK